MVDDMKARGAARKVNLNPQIKVANPDGTAVAVSVAGVRNPEANAALIKAAVKAGEMDLSLANFTPETIQVVVGGPAGKAFNLKVEKSGDLICKLPEGDDLVLGYEDAQNLVELGAFMLQAANSNTTEITRRDIGVDIARAVQRQCRAK